MQLDTSTKPAKYATLLRCDNPFAARTFHPELAVHSLLLSLALSTQLADIPDDDVTITPPATVRVLVTEVEHFLLQALEQIKAEPGETLPRFRATPGWFGRLYKKYGKAILGEDELETDIEEVDEETLLRRFIAAGFVKGLAPDALPESVPAITRSGWHTVAPDFQHIARKTFLLDTYNAEQIEAALKLFRATNGVAPIGFSDTDHPEIPAKLRPVVESDKEDVGDRAAANLPPELQQIGHDRDKLITERDALERKLADLSLQIDTQAKVVDDLKAIQDGARLRIRETRLRSDASLVQATARTRQVAADDQLATEQQKLTKLRDKARSLRDRIARRTKRIDTLRAQIRDAMRVA